MIFSMQRFIEDYLRNRNLPDDGQYSIKASNLYAKYRRTESDKNVLARLRKIQTVVYKNNPGVDRDSTERQLLERLDTKFSKGAIDLFTEPKARSERSHLKKAKRRSIGAILRSFQRAVQGRSIDAFWLSRKAGKLRSRPETIGQNLLTQFVLGILSNAAGDALREVFSGVGFIDLVVMLGTTKHLIEMKVQKGKFIGAAQLENYMTNENRRTGWLIIFDARKQTGRAPIPEKLKMGDKIIYILVIDINPVAPHKKN
jgi:hypothetical protein